MKTENTLENKAKFFAQYLNQKILYQDRIGNIVAFYLACGDFEKQVWVVSLEDENFEQNELSCNANILECKLILKSLSKISDEDAECVIKLVFAASINFNIEEFRKQIVLLILTNWNKSEVYDFLRSKGYALPYMDLSVEDLQNYGWIKLEE